MHTHAEETSTSTCTDTHRPPGARREHTSYQGHKYLSCYIGRERCTDIQADIHTEGVPSCSGITDSIPGKQYQAVQLPKHSETEDRQRARERRGRVIMVSQLGFVAVWLWGLCPYSKELGSAGKGSDKDAFSSSLLCGKVNIPGHPPLLHQC